MKVSIKSYTILRAGNSLDRKLCNKTKTAEGVEEYRSELKKHYYKKLNLKPIKLGDVLTENKGFAVEKRKATRIDCFKNNLQVVFEGLKCSE